MRLRLLCMGKLRTPEVSALVANYASLIPHYWPFELVELPDVRLGKGVASPERQKEAEGERFLAEVQPGDRVVLLDESGREYSSRELSEMIQRMSHEVSRRLIFIIGGPYGFSRAVYDRADSMLSLSRMTFPHELARLFAVEQLYRAGTIMRGEPYHHD